MPFRMRSAVMMTTLLAIVFAEEVHEETHAMPKQVVTLEIRVVPAKRVRSDWEQPPPQTPAKEPLRALLSSLPFSQGFRQNGTHCL